MHRLLLNASEKQLIAHIGAFPLDKPYFIAVSGLPGSGKTTLVEKLTAYFSERALRVSEDDFCTVPTKTRKGYLIKALDERDLKRLRYLASPEKASDNPYANPLSWYDWNDFQKCLQTLKRGKPFEKQGGWNQKTGECDRLVQLTPPPHHSPLYFIDTNYPFEVGTYIDLFVFVEASLELAAKGQAARDSHRSNEIYLTYKQMLDTLYCVPYSEKVRRRADFVIHRKDESQRPLPPLSI